MWTKVLLAARFALVSLAVLMPWLVGADRLILVAGVSGGTAIATGLIATFRTEALRVRDEATWLNDFSQLRRLWIVGIRSRGYFATVIAAAVVVSCLARMAVLIVLE